MLLCSTNNTITQHFTIGYCNLLMSDGFREGGGIPWERPTLVQAVTMWCVHTVWVGEIPWE
jgi:hypothetical protein